MTLAATRSRRWVGWGTRAASAPLLRGLLDHRVEVRRRAAIVLAEFVLLPEWSVDPLGRALRDEDVTVRDGVASALGRCRSFGALEAVAEALDDVVSSVRASAANALRELGELRLSQRSDRLQAQRAAR